MTLSRPYYDTVAGNDQSTTMLAIRECARDAFINIMTIYKPCIFTLVRQNGAYAIVNETNDNDVACFDTAQDAFDFWDWAHAGEPLNVRVS